MNIKRFYKSFLHFFSGILACLASLSFFGIHFGLMGLIMESYDPMAYTLLVAMLYAQNHLSLSTIYEQFQMFRFEQPLIHELTHSIQRTPPTDSDQLNQYLHFFMKPIEKTTNATIDRESVHQTSITQTALTSLRLLQQRYPDPRSFSIKDINHLNEYHEDARHALAIMETFHERHAPTGLSLIEVNALVWSAVLDTSPQTWGPHHSEDYVDARIESYLNTLRRIAHTERKNTLSQKKETLCFTGIYIMLLEVLSLLHPDVHLVYGSIDELFINRLKELFEERLANLSEQGRDALRHAHDGAHTEEVLTWHQEIQNILLEEFSATVNVQKIKEFSALKHFNDLMELHEDTKLRKESRI